MLKDRQNCFEKKKFISYLFPVNEEDEFVRTGPEPHLHVGVHLSPGACALSTLPIVNHAECSWSRGWRSRSGRGQNAIFSKQA